MFSDRLPNIPKPFCPGWEVADRRDQIQGINHLTAEEIFTRILMLAESWEKGAEILDGPDSSERNQGLAVGLSSSAKVLRDLLAEAQSHGKRIAEEQTKKDAAEQRRKDRMEALQRKAEAEGGEICDRCGGAGGYKGWPGFTCFKCDGHGYVVKEGARTA